MQGESNSIKNQKELSRKSIKMINSKKLYVCAENDNKLTERNAKLTR